MGQQLICPDLKGSAEVESLLDTSRMDFEPDSVSAIVNSAKNDDPRLLDRMGPPSLVR